MRDEGDPNLSDAASALSVARDRRDSKTSAQSPPDGFGSGAMQEVARALALMLGLGWVAALALPVATFGPGAGGQWDGWAVLLLGWLGILLGQFAWVANFLFAAALILLVRGRPPLVWGLMLGVLTSLLAAHALGFERVYTNDGEMPVLAFGAGYDLWIGVTFVGGVALCLAALGEAVGSRGAARIA